MHRRYLSGAAKRKIRDERAKSLAKIPKLSSFFKSEPPQKDAENKGDPAPRDLLLNMTENVKNVSEIDQSTTGTDANPNPNLQTTKISEIDLSRYSDAALWPDEINDDFRTMCIAKSPSFFQNIDLNGAYKASVREGKKQKRKLSAKLFSKTMSNGEKHFRAWLIYSLTSGNVYCFVCKLFGAKTSSFAASGFSDWKSAEEKTASHENSSEHRNTVLTWLNRRDPRLHIDSTMNSLLCTEREYWTNVLKRVVTVVKYLASRGLPFRGDDEKFGSRHNGDFLGRLEIISEFDPFLKAHIEKYGNKGSGNVSYLSKTICEEFMEILGKRTLEEIVKRIAEAKYYGLIVDSTPDLSHVDQLSVVIRYCHAGAVHESFISFLPIFSHTGTSLANRVLLFLQELGIDIINCRGQSYDNAANMSGKYNGMQAEIRKVNQLAFYVPCAAHSLNLVGQSSAESCGESTKFFMFLQKLYAFFSASTHRWTILTTKINNQNTKRLTLKPLSHTRWSSRGDAAKSLHENYNLIYEALIEIRDDENQRHDTKLESGSLAKTLTELETAFLTVLWNELLEKFHTVSKVLQKPGLNLKTGVNLLRGLRDTVLAKRDKITYFEGNAKKLSTFVR